MGRLPVSLFVATVASVILVHFVHLRDILIEEGRFGRINGESVTRSIVCTPFAFVACFVLFGRRFDRHSQRWGRWTVGIAAGCWIVLLFFDR
jgi:hypothetical protein